MFESGFEVDSNVTQLGPGHVTALLQIKKTILTYKNLASEDSRCPLTEILHESIDFQNCSKSYIFCSAHIDSQN